MKPILQVLLEAALALTVATLSRMTPNSAGRVASNGIDVPPCSHNAESGPSLVF